ncbi:AraC family transcriptional regulator [Lacihabitans sp. LS3-19]|uniref:AraC family transcriptional regulator n=1 Tax=Lacihabitans sp. LS3-19 TaxID=2487335 RepID=UPI0020CEB7C5|nr:AraC family transcriptional regulator [Lacihabitans sp. LS3-19]MCP9766481.1 AraC family transcriptional regulator [Lacihabitans sp. LS3-19]
MLNASQITLENINYENQNSSFSWLINPKLNDFFFWHFHPEFELVFIEAKEGTRHVGEHISKYYESDLVFIGSNIPHLNFDYGIKTEYKKTVLHIKPDFLLREGAITPELRTINKLFEKSKFGISFGKETKILITQKFKEAHKLPYFEQFISILEILKILGEAEDFELLHREIPKSQFNKKEETRLKVLYSFIELNFNRKIEIDEVAELSNLSPAAFCRYFKKMTKLSFIEFLNNYRINNAKRLLMNAKNVSEACFDSGFESLSYFNRTFKKVTGENPSNFRKNFSKL